MAINSDIRDQAYQFFTEEAPELLQVIEAGLLTLRQEHTTVNVHNIMRAAHSIKGGAASVELNAIATLAHRLESIFKALYSKTLEIDADLESQLLCAYDCLRLPLMEQITVGYFDAEPALANAELIFCEIEDQLGDAFTQVDSYLPTSAELGVDLTLSIFEVDVQEGLERLAAVLAYPYDYEVAGELRAQAEVFAGFSELLSLPEFGAIAQTSLAALDAHPNLALEITQLALTDFALIRTEVLAGKSTREKSPSAALVALANSTAINAPNHSEIIEVEFFTEEATSESETTLETPSLEEIFGSAGECSASSSLVPFTSFNLPQKLHSDVDGVFGNEEFNAPGGDKGRWGMGNRNSHSSTPHFQNSLSEERTNSTSNKLNQVSAYHRKSEGSVASNLTVRVDSERLGGMNNLVGELVINRNAVSLQNDQLQGVVQELLNRFAQVQNQISHLQEISDQMLVGAVAGSHWLNVVDRSNKEEKVLCTNAISYELSSRDNPNSKIQNPKFTDGQRITDNDNFDALELDRYGALHSVLQELIEEMVQLEASVGDIGLFAGATNRILEQQEPMLTQLRDQLMWVRMLPVGEVLQHFPRMLRDLSNTYRKPVSLTLSGAGVLVDKAVLEKLYDPILHLVRNAFDHGIESPEIRRQRGKPEEGHIEIRAYHKGSQTIIEVRDNGQGLNPERIGFRAIELGWLSVEHLSGISKDRLFEFIFEPGFSTVSQVSELSGRGVGLDVVRSQLRSIKGGITVNSSPGVGTIFTLTLPLTLSVAKLLICLVGSTVLGLPSDSVEEIVIPQTLQVQHLEGQRFLEWRGQVIPAYRLADCLDYACPLPETSPSKALVAVPNPEHWALPMLVLSLNTKFIALEIDSLVTEQELVIKPFGNAIAPPSFTYGCTILGDGRLVPVIDGNLLWEQVLSQTSVETQPTIGFDPLHAITVAEEGVSAANQLSSVDKTKFAIKPAPIPTILIVDDAVTLRRTLALTWEREGFRVLQARDGQEAIEQLQQNSSVQLVICDIEMPNMNGFEFLSYRRQDSQLLNIPVVMLTSRSNDKHRWLAMQLGATAYFTKPYVEHEFLEAIKDIIAEFTNIN